MKLTPRTQDELAAHVQATANLLRRRMTAETAMVYVKALPSDLTLDDAVAALDRLAATADDGTQFPLPRQLAARARGVWPESSRGLTDHQTDTVCQRVWRSMAEWERTHSIESARLAFEQVWREALHAEGLAGCAPPPAGFEGAWRHWLCAGENLTRDRMNEILRAVAPRMAPTSRTAIQAPAARLVRMGTDVVGAERGPLGEVVRTAIEPGAVSDDGKDDVEIFE